MNILFRQMILYENDQQNRSGIFSIQSLVTFSKSTLLELQFCHDTLAFQPSQIFALGFHVLFECRWTKNEV